MAYEATRNDYSEDSKELEKKRNDSNNARNVRNAADVAIASGNPYAMAAGFAVKGADKLSGGRASNALGKGMSTANRIVPAGKSLQNVSNNLSESGVSDVAGRAASIKNGIDAKSGGEEKSLPSSVGNDVENNAVVSSNEGISANSSVSNTSESSSKKDDDIRDKDRDKDYDNDNDNEEKKGGLFGNISATVVRVVAITILPFIFFIFVVLIFIVAIFGSISNFEDAFGVSKIAGEEVGGDVVDIDSPEKKEFYERVNDVKLSYLANGKEVDVLKVTSVFHQLNTYGANLKYEKITTSMIEEVADSMLKDNVYDEETFKENLKNNIIPKYLKNKSDAEKELIINEILEHSNEYHSLIGEESDPTASGAGGSSGNSCIAVNTCYYDIKGYSISGKGNVSENSKLKDIYVRLYQCDGKVMSGEDLVPFEKYILGVLYMSSSDTNAEVVKAQSVSLRSSVMALHAAGGSSKLKMEGNRWILSIPSCKNYTYCNPDTGCSKDSNGNVVSGTTNGEKIKDPLPSTSLLKTYVESTAGEMLANSQGYVIDTKYNPSNIVTQSGLSYKQILVQSYGSSLGASNILKNSCSMSTTSCISSGEYAGWKQRGSPWSNVQVGDSGRNIGQIGCLATSIAMLIAKSGVPTNIPNFNPGTFVEYLNSHGGFSSGGNLNWSGPTKAAPSFKYAGDKNLSGLSRQDKLNAITSIVSQPKTYAVCEVKGNTGQHWVAIDSVSGVTINMMDPSTSSTDMWAQYDWQNTSRIVYFKVS